MSIFDNRNLQSNRCNLRTYKDEEIESGFYSPEELNNEIIILRKDIIICIKLKAIFSSRG